MGDRWLLKMTIRSAPLRCCSSALLSAGSVGGAVGSVHVLLRDLHASQNAHRQPGQLHRETDLRIRADEILAGVQEDAGLHGGHAASEPNLHVPLCLLVREAQVNVIDGDPVRHLRVPGDPLPYLLAPLLSEGRVQGLDHARRRLVQVRRGAVQRRHPVLLQRVRNALLQHLLLPPVRGKHQPRPRLLNHMPERSHCGGPKVDASLGLAVAQEWHA
mmetsp:Transcript_4613/g.13721  ORF Transcript_4613/g.13721 Transcript_4613/m.13721 type:complete len:216 (-) Transcript_4613:838-1485(-)